MAKNKFFVWSVFGIITVSLLINSFAVTGQLTAYRPHIKPVPLLISYWNFNEGSGNTVYDQTNNGNNGGLQGDTQWTLDSISGYALMFDGNGDKIDITKTTSVDVTKKVIVEAWIKPTSNSDGTILAKNGPYYIAIENSKIRGGVYANDGTPGTNTWTHVLGTTSLNLNTWYKVKMSYDGKKVRVFVNDILDGQDQKIGEMPQVSQQVYIGWGEPGLDQFFTGIIDEVKIYGN